MTTYSMTPINNGTRIREYHSVWDAVIASYNRGQVVIGDEIWEAPADGSEVKKGDKWLHVTHVDGVAVENGWMAYIHKGVAICNNFKEVNSPPVPSEPILYPESVVWEYVEPSTGQKVRLLFEFVRIVE